MTASSIITECKRVWVKKGEKTGVTKVLILALSVIGNFGLIALAWLDSVLLGLLFEIAARASQEEVQRDGGTLQFGDERLAMCVVACDCIIFVLR